MFAVLGVALLVALPAGAGTELGGRPGGGPGGGSDGWFWTPPGSCPHYCTCYSWSGLRRADCVDRRLASVDLALPTDVEVADLSCNIIPTLEDGCFQVGGARLGQASGLRPVWSGPPVEVHVKETPIALRSWAWCS